MNEKHASHTEPAYGVKKIAIIGPESTGKSELAQQLAAHYGTEWVPEYARFYLDGLDRPYEQKDLLTIAKGQLAWEEEKMRDAQRFLFCDTNLVVIKVWSDHKYGHTDEWIEASLRSRHYDLYLLNDIGLPWEPDPQREHPEQRNYFMGVYRSYLEVNQLPFAIISGLGEERTQSAVDAIAK